MKLTRREFMLQAGSCVGYALGAAAFAAGVQRFALIDAFAQSADYRALVCVFLAGGNDGNNMIVPTSTTEYNLYATARSASGLNTRFDLPFSVLKRRRNDWASRTMSSSRSRSGGSTICTTARR